MLERVTCWRGLPRDVEDVIVSRRHGAVFRRDVDHNNSACPTRDGLASSVSQR